MRFNETATLVPPPMAYGRQAARVASPALGLLDAATAAETTQRLQVLVRTGVTQDELSRPGCDGWSSEEERLRPLVCLAVAPPDQVCQALERSLGSMRDAAPAAAILRHRGLTADVEECLLRLSYQGSYGRDGTRFMTPASPHRRAFIAEALLIGICSRSAAAHGVHARWLRSLGTRPSHGGSEGKHDGAIATVLESWSRAGHVPRSLVPIALGLLSRPGRAHLGRLLEDVQERFSQDTTVSWSDLGSRLIGQAGDYQVRHRQLPEKWWLAKDMEDVVECSDGPPF